MANYSNYGGYAGSRGGGSYQSRGFQNGYNTSGDGYRDGGQSFSGRSRGGSPGVKKSGCKMRDSYRRGGSEVVNAPCITGWKKPAGQPFMKFVAVPCKDPSTKSDRWKKFVVTVQRENQAEELTTGFWDVEKKRLRMPDYGGGMVANPNAPNGGYWGRSGPIRQNRNGR